MELVVDANVLFSALIAEGKTRELLYSEKLNLIAPEFLLTEVENHEKEICEKSGLSKEDFEFILILFRKRIDIIPREDFEEYLIRANKRCPDPDDTEYLALAMSEDAILWSDEKKLKDQDEVEVISTSELITLLKKKKSKTN
ncbi:MAG: PIN domain-containing protein [Thermoplasmatota archaeon]